ncbi:hypothetical protein BLNAU_12613 [Blattamonas nauphoetae]|uniref:Uncharacterized protein n=1 Tax=Blattamonas nauphoetae TaxID=2049346 RepID=A0ABQ9XLZ8_9EUKA|nr:hypothetical protein BLNAU_12609 [Blattamonas nauphoetae]KAK2952503.1 hypothetical protein BLNAU_12611 [Blattamonas nauphoetae]KAK2952505.1 hypothetical protein BLNAU_12613 [Blattamonas nauphoetae]
MREKICDFHSDDLDLGDLGHAETTSLTNLLDKNLSQIVEDALQLNKTDLETSGRKFGQSKHARTVLSSLTRSHSPSQAKIDDINIQLQRNIVTNNQSESRVAECNALLDHSPHFVVHPNSETDPTDSIHPHVGISSLAQIVLILTSLSDTDQFDANIIQSALSPDLSIVSALSMTRSSALTWYPAAVALTSIANLIPPQPAKILEATLPSPSIFESTFVLQAASTLLNTSHVTVLLSSRKSSQLRTALSSD